MRVDLSCALYEANEWETGGILEVLETHAASFEAVFEPERLLGMEPGASVVVEGVRSEYLRTSETGILVPHWQDTNGRWQVRIPRLLSARRGLTEEQFLAATRTTRARVVFCLGHGIRLLPETIYIHHLNRNPSDDRLENLAPMYAATHMLGHRTEAAERANLRRS